MTVVEILEMLDQWLREMTTAKNVRHQLKGARPSLETMIELEKAKHRGRPPSAPVQEAPLEVENKIQQLFEQPIAGLMLPGSKEYFHIENRQGKRCWDARQQRELEQNITHTDRGSPAFSAQRKGLCSECGQPIEPGDGIHMRAKEQGVA